MRWRVGACRSGFGPGWGGNDIIQYVREAGLKATLVDASTFRWELETTESDEHRSPGLVTVGELAGPGQPWGWERLAGGR
jgi:hypothetical protein